MKIYLQKLFFQMWLVLFKEKNSDIWCHHSGKFYGVYFSDIKKWKIRDGDYCELNKKV